MTRRDLVIPVAIVFTGIVIAVALYVVRINQTSVPVETSPNAVRPVSPDDHIVGRPDAPIVLITYTDVDCQYCRSFQEIMTQIMTEYGTTGDVAWVYRHFPLIGIHANAISHAEAAECMADVGGENRFWLFLDALQASEAGSVSTSAYDRIVSQLGGDTQAFTSCLASDRMMQSVNDDFANALEVGAEGAPYNILLVRGQEPRIISGALPYDAMKRVLDAARADVVE